VKELTPLVKKKVSSEPKTITVTRPIIKETDVNSVVGLSPDEIAQVGKKVKDIMATRSSDGVKESAIDSVLEEAEAAKKDSGDRDIQMEKAGTRMIKDLSLKGNFDWIDNFKAVMGVESKSSLM
jgi:hypothetical protein